MCPCEPRACLFLIRRVLTDSAFRDSPLAYIIMPFLLLHGTPSSVFAFVMFFEYCLLETLV